MFGKGFFGRDTHDEAYHGGLVAGASWAVPEGTKVTVTCNIVTASRKRRKKSAAFPLIHSKHPGSLHLTGRRIAEILDEEDAAPRR